MHYLCSALQAAPLGPDQDVFEVQLEIHVHPRHDGIPEAPGSPAEPGYDERRHRTQTQTGARTEGSTAHGSGPASSAESPWLPRTRSALPLCLSPARCESGCSAAIRGARHAGKSQS